MMKPLLRSLFMIAMLLLTARAAQHGLSAPSTSGQAFLQFPAAMPSYTVTDLGT
ncbi:MAG: hypothetical protein HUU38_29230, partial [Anaerolineales bacterium]|nr:hypothetical protein [Anaerolineales bacterium]